MRTIELTDEQIEQLAEQIVNQLENVVNEEETWYEFEDEDFEIRFSHWHSVYLTIFFQIEMTSSHYYPASYDYPAEGECGFRVNIVDFVEAYDEEGDACAISSESWAKLEKIVKSETIRYAWA